MPKDQSEKDIISEKEYTLRMRSASSQPEDDSPGDSESDAGSEIEMGLEYLPDENIDSGETIDEVTLLDPPAGNPTTKFAKHPIKEIPENSKVISSDMPSPSMDRGKSTSTH